MRLVSTTLSALSDNYSMTISLKCNNGFLRFIMINVLDCISFQIVHHSTFLKFILQKYWQKKCNELLACDQFHSNLILRSLMYLGLSQFFVNFIRRHQLCYSLGQHLEIVNACQTKFEIPILVTVIPLIRPQTLLCISYKNVKIKMSQSKRHFNLGLSRFVKYCHTNKKQIQEGYDLMHDIHVRLYLRENVTQIGWNENRLWVLER